MKQLALGFGIGLAIWLMTQGKAQAHPTSFKDSITVMSNNTESMNDVMVAYSVKSNLALGASYLGMEGSDFYLARANMLLKRWNNFDSQGNIYFVLGTGMEVFEKSSGPVHQAEIMMDWEDRDYYISLDHLYLNRDAKLNPLIAEDHLHYTKVRAGLSPFVGEYTGLNVWFILQAEKYNTSDEVLLSQLFRFYIKNTLWEVGATFKGGFVFNYMLHF